MLKILIGNEPYLVDCLARKECRLQCPEFNFLKSSSYGAEEEEFLSGYPLMDDKRVLLLILKKLDDLKGACYDKWANDDETAVVIAKVSEYDARTSFYKECVKKGLIVSCSKKDLNPSIVALLKKRAGDVVPELVLEAMVKRVGYLENDAVNMYTLVGYLNTLLSLGEDVTIELMESVVPSYFKEDVFSLAKMICSKNVQDLRKQAELLRGDEIRTLSALLREFRISYKAKYFSLKEIGVSYSSFLKKDKEYLLYGISVIGRVVDGIKNGTIITKGCLMDVFLQLLNWEGGKSNESGANS